MSDKKDQAGFTLIEVIVGLVLITIILISFFSFFISSMKTTTTSNTILDATYYAQREMEQLYTLSQKTSISNLETEITFVPLSGDQKYYYASTGTTGIYEKWGNTIEDPSNIYYYQLTCVAQPFNVTKIIMKVFDQKDGVLKVQMEGLYEWRP